MSNPEDDTSRDCTLEMDLVLTPSEADVFRTLKSAQAKTTAENTLPPTMNRLARFTGVRLLISRLLRTLNTALQLSKHIAFSFFQHACAIGGLSYLVDVIICGKIMWQWMFAQKNKDKGFWDRWNQMPNKTALVYNFWNGVVWFAVNFICFFLAPPVAIALNFAGFIFDIGNEIYKTYYDIKPQQNLLAKIENKIDSTEYSTEDKAQLEAIKSELIEKMASTKRNRYWTIFTATCIVVGIALFAFCPPAALAGALVMLIGGSVIGGFGRWVFTRVSEWLAKPRATGYIPVSTGDDDVSTKTDKHELTELSTAAKVCKELRFSPMSRATTEQPSSSECTSTPSPILSPSSGSDSPEFTYPASQTQAILPVVIGYSQ